MDGGSTVSKGGESTPPTLQHTQGCRVKLKSDFIFRLNSGNQKDPYPTEGTFLEDQDELENPPVTSYLPSLKYN